MSDTYRFALKTELDMFCTWLEDSTNHIYTARYCNTDGSYLLIQNMQRKQLKSRTICEFAAVYHPPGEGKVPKYTGRAFQFELFQPPHPNVVVVVASLVRPDAATAYGNVLRMITDAYPEAFETLRKQMGHTAIQAVDADDIHPDAAGAVLVKD